MLILLITSDDYVTIDIKESFVLGDKIRLNDNSFMFIVQRQYFYDLIKYIPQ